MNARQQNEKVMMIIKISETTKKGGFFLSFELTSFSGHLITVSSLFYTYPQCSLSSAISRVCTHSGASCRKTNLPMRLCCRYQAKHSKLTEEIRLLSEATTYIFPHRNV